MDLVASHEKDKKRKLEKSQPTSLKLTKKEKYRTNPTKQQPPNEQKAIQINHTVELSTASALLDIAFYLKLIVIVKFLVRGDGGHYFPPIPPFQPFIPLLDSGLPWAAQFLGVLGFGC